MKTDESKTEAKDTCFKVFATYESVLSGAKIKFQLVNRYDGVCFQNLETLSYEHGTFIVSGGNKFESIILFLAIFKEMKPSFTIE